MKTLAIVAVLVFAGAAVAAEQAVLLQEGPGRDKVTGNCGTCHSLDYIQGNAPFMNRQVWDAEVTKMIKVFGAPISEVDAKEIVDYLNARYGQP
jgi:sulfite dehydrogenase (cytochrome) subunit B